VRCAFGAACPPAAFRLAGGPVAVGRRHRLGDRWHGAFYAADNDGDTVEVIVGTFWPGTVFTAT
jgi:hypothetical protein